MQKSASTAPSANSRLTQVSAPDPNQIKIKVSNMMLKRLVAGGDDWCIPMDAGHYGHGVDHNIDNLLGSEKSGQDSTDRNEEYATIQWVASGC